MSIEIKITDTTNVQFPIVIKDKKGNEIYCQNEDGRWCKYTYDDNRNVLTIKNSNGYCSEYTYDDNGKELTFKNSIGDYRIKDEYVTKEEFELFVNGTPEYTMEELTVKLGHNFKIKKK
jgi:YD repeat-containing protein